MEKQWKYCRVERTDVPREHCPVSLHDQIATDARIEGDRLIFDLADGFFVSPRDESNPHGEWIRTTASRVVFRIEDSADMVGLRQLHWHRLFRGHGFTTVTWPPVRQLIERIHSGKWQLEFLYRYSNFKGTLLCCMIHSKRKFYDLQLDFQCDGVEFYWNDFDPRYIP